MIQLTVHDCLFIIKKICKLVRFLVFDFAANQQLWSFREVGRLLPPYVRMLEAVI